MLIFLTISHKVMLSHLVPTCGTKLCELRMLVIVMHTCCAKHCHAAKQDACLTHAKLL